MSKILDNLYLGSIYTAQSPSFIQNNNIKLIINAAREVNIPFYDSVQLVLNLNWVDNLDQEITTAYLDYLSNVIDNHLRNNMAVLVNCFAGISRSSTIIIAYLMNKHNMSLVEAISYVKDKRYIINPNPNFLNILKRYEQYLQYKRSLY